MPVLGTPQPASPEVTAPSVAWPRGRDHEEPALTSVGVQHRLLREVPDFHTADESSGQSPAPPPAEGQGGGCGGALTRNPARR